MSFLFHRTHRYAWLVLSIALLLTLPGCGSDNSPPSLSQLKRESIPSTISYSRLDSEFENKAARAIKFGDRVVAQLENIDNEASAQKAYEKIQKLFLDFTKYHRDKYLNVKIPQNERLLLKNVDYVPALIDRRATWASKINDFQRSSHNLGLSPETNRGLQMALRELTSMSFDVGLMLSDTNDFSTISLFAQGSPDAYLLAVYIKSIFDEEDRFYIKAIRSSRPSFLPSERDEPTFTQYIRISGVDFNRVRDAIDIGTIAETDSSAKAMRVVLTAEDIQKLRDKNAEYEQRLAQKEEDERNKQIAEKEERKDQERVRLAATIDEALAPRDAALSKIVETLKSMTDIPTTRAGFKETSSARRDYERAQASLNRMLSSYNVSLDEEYKYDDKAPAMMAEIQTELDRIKQDIPLRILVTRNLCPQLEAGEFIRFDSRIEDPAEDENHPDYVLSNWFDLVYGSDFLRTKAIARIAEMDPNEVDNEVRGKMARAIKNYYEIASDYNKPKAIIPLAKWGGKYSVPLLLKIMQEDLDRRNAEVLFKAVSEYPSAEVATAVANCVGDRDAHEHACQCLVEMGPVAEDAVLKIAPSDDEKVSAGAIIVLGEIGTEKSISLLRKAVASRNPSVKQAAILAINKIQARSGE